MSFKDVYKSIQPNVINNEMITKAIDDQAPKGEAGRLRRLEGIAFSEVTTLRLEFMNILRIDHLWMLTSIRKLSLSNNLIERIENLNTLVNLKELDLSFNYVKKIENMDDLVNLEILTLYHNQITAIENVDTLRKLVIFSIGQNQIKQKESVFPLRMFKDLRSVNMAGNPCAEEEDFRIFVATFLPQINYYEYVRVSADERKIGVNLYGKLLEEVIDSEVEIREREAKEEAERAEAELHSESFIEFLGSRQLFDAMFEKDMDGKLLMLIGSEIEEYYQKYEEEFLNTTKQLFEIGQEQYKIRKHEVQMFFNSADNARLENQRESQNIMEDFLEQKREIFRNIKDMQEHFDYSDEELIVQYAEKMTDYAADMSEMIHHTWKQLMGLELSLFDRVEEANLKFERILTDLVNGFIEQAQGLFTICRNLECTYMDEVNDAALRLMSAYISREVEIKISPELIPILEDKEVLNNSIGASHDRHMQIIDAREDKLVSRAKSWLNNLVENLTKNEVERNRGKILEINHFLDIQHEEFEELQNAPVGELQDDDDDD